MDTSELARKNHATVLQCLATASQKRVADVLGVHESTVSRMKGPDAEIETIMRLLAALNLKVVAADEQTFPPGILTALHELAAVAINDSALFETLRKR